MNTESEVSVSDNVARPQLIPAGLPPVVYPCKTKIRLALLT